MLRSPELMARATAANIGGLPTDTASIGMLLSTAGSDRFDSELQNLLRQACHAEFVHLFTILDGVPETLACLSVDSSDFASYQTKLYNDNMFWRRDTAMKDASRCGTGAPIIFHLDTAGAVDGELRGFWQAMDMRERTIVLGRTETGIVGLSIGRSSRAFQGRRDPQEFALLQDLVFPIVSKHIDLRESRRLRKADISSLQSIGLGLADSKVRFTARESQVAARLIFGLSANEVSCDLRIAYQTVICYRKRIYERLELRSHRELLLWYLGLATA